MIGTPNALSGGQGIPIIKSGMTPVGSCIAAMPLLGRTRPLGGARTRPEQPPFRMGPKPEFGV
jgi:hypothetical protein